MEKTRRKSEAMTGEKPAVKVNSWIGRGPTPNDDERTLFINETSGRADERLNIYMNLHIEELCR